MKPKLLTSFLVLILSLMTCTTSIFAFNPQPEPPGKIILQYKNPIVEVTINPQPEPPGAIIFKSSY